MSNICKIYIKYAVNLQNTGFLLIRIKPSEKERKRFKAQRN